MEILKLKLLEHSGQGKNATHLKVIEAFNTSVEEGKRYCFARGWQVGINDNILTVSSKAMFGFKMIALFK